MTDVLLIRAVLRKHEWTWEEIRKCFGISTTQIYRIKNRINWSWL